MSWMGVEIIGHVASEGEQKHDVCAGKRWRKLAVRHVGIWEWDVWVEGTANTKALNPSVSHCC